MSTIVNRRDTDFVMYEALELERILASDRYADYDREAIDAIMDLAQSVAEDKYQPSAGHLDANEPKFVSGKAVTDPATKLGLEAYNESGLSLTGYAADIGGMQLPWMAHQAVNAMFTCANPGIASYSFLTQGAANMLYEAGSQALKDKYLPNMVSGKWCGTMCLSEPHAGSSLADIRTKAEPVGDGTYKLSGTKMWISGGDQDLTENIIHMVLAKIPGSPAGVKGISLFLVPKMRVNDAGEVTEHNNIALAGLNHKMGHRGTTNCLLNFGEGGDTLGFLVGGENQGLATMFLMMNEARIGVGMGAVQSALAGYLYSLGYARQRPQGRPIGNKDPESPQVMISEHADIKRMLMAQKAAVEGAYTLINYCAQLIDDIKLSEDKQEQDRLNLLLELLTPICKSWPSEYCLEANKLAIQILGGYGYTREYPVERFYRDNRLNHIHEGTWAIHGIDILGRKVRIAGGAAMQILAEEIQATIAAAAQYSALQGYGDQLVAALELVEKTLSAVSQSKDQALALANATLFLNAMGHIVIAWMWLKQAIAASKGLENGKAADQAFYQGKLAANRYFFKYELPRIRADLDIVASLDDTCLSLSAEHFVGV